MRSIAVNSNYRGFEQYEAIMVGDSSSPSFQGQMSSASFDEEAPLDGRPFIEDDHRVSVASASSEE